MPSSRKRSHRSSGLADGPIHQTGSFSAGTRARTSRTSPSTSSASTETPLIPAHVGPSMMQTRSSANRTTLAPGAMCVNRSGVSAYSRSSAGIAVTGRRSRLAMRDQRAQALLHRAARSEHRGRLVAAMRHTVVAARIVAAAVLRPVGRLDQLAIRLRVAVRHEVARTLPAEHGVRRNPPRRALEVDLPLEEVEKERRVVEAPALAPAVRERRTEELPRRRHTREVL